jgi:predicted nucleic acid-binding protein
MKTIVDTSVWSLALRRNQAHESQSVIVLRDLITDGRVVLLGAVRQEILSGIRHLEQFSRLKEYLRAFPNLELTIADYELASEFYNICRNQGIQGANTDFLICAAAVQKNYAILTTDQDFENFKRYLPIQLMSF